MRLWARVCDSITWRSPFQFLLVWHMPFKHMLEWSAPPLIKSWIFQMCLHMSSNTSPLHYLSTYEKSLVSLGLCYNSQTYQNKDPMKQVLSRHTNQANKCPQERVDCHCTATSSLSYRISQASWNLQNLKQWTLFLKKWATLHFDGIRASPKIIPSQNWCCHLERSGVTEISCFLNFTPQSYKDITMRPDVICI